MPAAYEAYSRGLHHWNLRTEPALRLAIRHFEEAVSLDPGYALAHAALADSYLLVGYYRYAFMPRDEAYRRAQAGALRAVALDDTLAEAHVTIASFKSDYEGDAAGAESGFRRAIQLSPDYPLARLRYSVLLYAQGRFSESYDEVRQAHRLDPLSRAVNVNLIALLVRMRDYDKAEEHCAKAKEIAPADPYLLVYCGVAAEQKGQVEAAYRSYQAALRISPAGTEPYALALQYYGLACAATGREGEARRAAAELAPLTEQDADRFIGVAGIYARLGETGVALGYLKKLILKSPASVSQLQGDPRTSLMGGDPRYAALLKEHAGGQGR